MRHGPLARDWRWRSGTRRRYRPRVSELRIRISRRNDGGSVLHCTRADGSVTWQRQRGAQASFFPLHDLTYYAIEHTLGYRRGFYGLIADGWEIADTEGKGPRGPLPDEAIEVEHFVGAMDLERAGAASWSAEDFNAQAATFAAAAGRAAPRPVTDEELSRVRSCARELHARWSRTAIGASMELEFDRGEDAPP